jgi:hypothetical protein
MGAVMSPVFGLNAEGIRRTAETNRRVLDALPPTGRRTRRLYPPGTGGGTSLPLIEFQLTAVDCLSRTALGIVVGVTCGSSTPQLGEEVELYDDAGCMLTGDAFKLQGRRGFAQKMDIVDSQSQYTYGCPYIVISICGEGFRC